MNGATSSGKRRGLTHSQASNSGCSVARLMSASRAGEPHREPFLAIAAILPSHHTVGNFVRHLEIKPAPAPRKDIGSVGADLLLQLTQRRPARGFAGVDAALRHLPLRQPSRHADATTDEHEIIAAEQHDPHPGPVIRELERPVASKRLSTPK